MKVNTRRATRNQENRLINQIDEATFRARRVRVASARVADLRRAVREFEEKFEIVKDANGQVTFCKNPALFKHIKTEFDELLRQKENAEREFKDRREEEQRQWLAKPYRSFTSSTSQLPKKDWS
jgi:hypothetical protein